MIEHLDPHMRRGWRVGDHDVEGMQGQLRDELFRIVFPAHQLHRLCQVSRRPQQTADDQLGHRVGDANGQLQGPARRPAPEGLDQLPADAKNFVGVPEHDATGVGEGQRSSLPFEESLAQRLFETANLRTDGRLGQAQLVRRLRHSALLNHRPEIQQVMVVQPR